MRTIRLRESLEVIDLAKSTIYRLLAGGEFPESSSLRHCVGWVEEEVIERVLFRIDELDVNLENTLDR
ncbi:MAG: AlpA family phage regulatory protein [Pseudomonas sp.]|uniref:AlpA family phage regulatory protein n=1 Tax=Pseudomonas nitroreducens TaxID=46680 RepID=UPI002D7E498A|nr:AlpA family phage regulatory protein [Pseudomonas nitroreducens]